MELLIHIVIENEVEMEPVHEIVNTKESRFPIRIFRRSSMNEYIHVHPHWHDHYEILLIEKGSGTQQIGPHVFTFHIDDILPIPCDAVHSTYTELSCENEMTVITFHQDFLYSGIMHTPERQILDTFFYSIQLPPAIKKQEDNDNQLHAILENIIKEWQDEKIGKELIIRSRLLEWIVLAVRQYSEGKTYLRTKESYRIKEILENAFQFIDKNFSNRISISKAATNACLSVSQFERIFKGHTGQTYISYVNRYRIQKASEQMDSDKNLTEIALNCGFNNLATFTRVFREIKGIPPSMYRKG